MEPGGVTIRKHIPRVGTILEVYSGSNHET
jgi:hypothetical protein